MNYILAYRRKEDPISTPLRYLQGQSYKYLEKDINAIHSYIDKSCNTAAYNWWILTTVIS